MDVSFKCEIVIARKRGRTISRKTDIYHIVSNRRIAKGVFVTVTRPDITVMVYWA